MMKSFLKRFVIGFFLSLIICPFWLSLVYFGYRLFKIPLIPILLFESIINRLPGTLINFTLEWMIKILFTLKLGPLADVAKITELIFALSLAILGLSLVGGIASLFSRPYVPWILQGGTLGGVLWIISMYLISSKYTNLSTGSLIWLFIIHLVWSLVYVKCVKITIESLDEPINVRRKGFLAKIWLTSITISGLALGLERLISNNRKTDAVQSTTPNPIQTSSTQQNPLESFEPVPGTRPEITPLEDFYRVDINLLPPDQMIPGDNSDNLAKVLASQGGEIDVPNDSYTLLVGGLVETPLLLSLDAIKNLPNIELFATLSCISNPIGGDLIGTTNFKGVSLKTVLEKAELKTGATEIKFTCADGYTESLPLESALEPNTILCFEMGNQPLSKEHGAPLRLYTPNRYGMKCPKWIIKIEAIDQSYLGYWEQRGWSVQAWVQPTAVIDTFRRINADTIEIGGIAYTGSRGIQAVQARVDQLEWVTCQLKTPLSPFTWSLWRALLTISIGKHQIYVRIIDGNGEIQNDERKNAFPDGATGYHSIKINIQ